MIGRALRGGDEIRKLGDRVLGVVTGKRVGVGIEVDGEGVELGNLVHAMLRVVDIGRLPVLVRRIGLEAGKGEADGERMPGDREAILVANVDVLDLDLDVVDAAIDELGHDGLVLSALLSRLARRLDLQRLGIGELLLLDGLLSALVLLRVVRRGRGGHGEEVDVVEIDLNRLTA